MTGRAFEEKESNGSRPFPNLVLEETRRLIVALGELVTNHDATLRPDHEADAEVARAFDPDEIRKTLRKLEDRIDRCRFEVAVVGTMKAGKSTGINAVVGSEVVPSRTTPMTTIPTVIEHVPGQVDAILSLPEDEVQALIELCRSRPDILDNRKAAIIEDRDIIADLLNDEVEVESDAILIRGEKQSPKRSLRVLNDLVRLVLSHAPEDSDEEASKVLFRILDDLPTLRIEFRCLREVVTDDPGSFALIDTPGPNEFGMSRWLTDVVQKLLHNCHGVLLFIKSTELNSESEAQLRSQVDELGSVLDDRLHVVANQVDVVSQQDGGAFLRDLPSIVRDRLFDGRIDLDRVFPASALRAWLAIQASRSGEGHEGDWFADFREQVWGILSPDEISDEDIAQGGRILWERSGFGKPLERVIRRGRLNASIHLAESCLAEVRELARKLSGAGALGRLRGEIETLEWGIKLCQRLMADTERQVDELDHRLDPLGEELTSLMKNKVREIKELSSKRIDAVIESRERATPEAEQISIGNIKNQLKLLRRKLTKLGQFSNVVRTALSKFILGQENPPEPAVDLKELQMLPRVIEAESGDEIEQLAREIVNTLGKLMDYQTAELREEVVDLLDETSKRVTSDINEDLAPTLSELRDFLREEQIDPGVIPAVSQDAWNEVPSWTAEHSEFVDSREQRTGYREEKKPGFKGWFGRYGVLPWLIGKRKEWGFKRIAEYRTVASLDVDRLIANFHEATGGHLAALTKNVEECIIPELKAGLEEWVRKLRDLLDGMLYVLRNERARDLEDAMSATREQLLDLEENSTGVARDSELLRSDLKILRSTTDSGA